jgi:signal transduction histidine kinase
MNPAAPPTRHPTYPLHLRWLIPASVVCGALAVLPWVTSFGPLTGDTGGIVAAVVVTAIAGLPFLAASRRRDFDARLRQALLLFSVSTLLVAAGNLLRLLAALGLALPTIPGLDITSTVLIWALGLAALLRFPLTPLTRGVWWRMATDTTIAVGGMALAIFAIWTLPGLRHASSSARLHLLAYNLMEAANLVVLNLILVRGPSRPIRAAFWWLAAIIVIETTYLVALQYAIGRQSHDFRLPNSLFFFDYLAYLYAGTFFLRSPQPDSDVPLLPESLRAFNPLPMLAILGAGTLLILAALHPADPALLPLAAGIVVLALLLLGRVVGATTENLRLLREDVAEERRRHAERQVLMSRLAGGIAHNINNQMTVVLGHAEMNLELRVGDRELRANNQAIADAAQRAAALAERLVLASGRTPGDRQRKPLAEVVRAEAERWRPPDGGAPRVVWQFADGCGAAPVGPAAVGAILKELLANAVDATPVEGTVTVRVYDEVLLSPAPGMAPLPPPGRYSVLEVADTGCGIPPADLPHVHDPFFTTRPLHEGRGLGLSVVYGIVAGMGGGLLVQSVPGAGATDMVYLPILPDERTPQEAMHSQA